MISLRGIAIASCCVLVSGCNEASREAAAVEPSSVPSAETASSDQLQTVEDLMTDLVMPSADKLWRAVSYVSTAEGVTETAPQSDEDWAALRDSANALIEAGDELLNTNREILTNTFDPGTASFQLTPDEIKQAIAENPEPWRNYITQMQDSTRMTLQAIEFRDLMGLVEFGAQINEACEGCHAAYWYRPAGMMVPQ